MTKCNEVTYLDDGSHVHCQLDSGHFGRHFCRYPGGTVSWESLADRYRLMGYPVRVCNWLNQWYLVSSVTSDNWPPPFVRIA